MVNQPFSFIYCYRNTLFEDRDSVVQAITMHNNLYKTHYVQVHSKPKKHISKRRKTTEGMSDATEAQQVQCTGYGTYYCCKSQTCFATFRLKPIANGAHPPKYGKCSVHLCSHYMNKIYCSCCCSKTKRNIRIWKCSQSSSKSCNCCINRVSR